MKSGYFKWYLNFFSANLLSLWHNLKIHAKASDQLEKAQNRSDARKVENELKTSKGSF